ncbi:hypothetical protein ZWY2020_000264 [Hordeum vulgare]|nr:hypothetical protein ZWY2020_000264 [Hordeum vulgare]
MAEKSLEKVARNTVQMVSEKAATAAPPKAAAVPLSTAKGMILTERAHQSGLEGVAATPATLRTDRSASRGFSKSPEERKTPDPASSLSAKLGGMVLMEKEAQGFVFEDPVPAFPKDSRWSAVGKVCSPRHMNFMALERTMQKSMGVAS